MNKLKSNIIYNYVYQFLMLCFPLIITPYISRTLGASGIGIYSYNYSIAYYFVSIAALGLSNYGTRTISKEYAENGRNVSKIFWEIYSTQFLCALVASIFYITYIAFVSSNAFLSTIFGFYVLSSFFDITWLFFGLEQFKIVFTRNLFIKVLTSVLIFFLVTNQECIVEYSLIMTVSILVSQGLLWIYVPRYIKFEKISFRRAFKRHFKPNLILFIPVIAVSIYRYMDKIILGSLSTTTELGYYENVEKIVNIPVAFVTALGTVMLSRATKLYAKDDYVTTKKYMDLSIIFTFFISSGMVFGIIGVIREFIPIFFGNGFEKCVNLAFIMIPTVFFLGLSNVIRTQYLIPVSKDNVYIVSVLCGAVINLLLNIVLVPSYKSLGSAIATFFAEAVVFLYQLFKVKKELKITRSLVKGLGFVVIGLFMAIFLLNLKINIFSSGLLLLVKIMVGFLIYIILSIVYSFLAFKEVRKRFSECLLNI